MRVREQHHAAQCLKRIPAPIAVEVTNLAVQGFRRGVGDEFAVLEVREDFSLPVFRGFHQVRPILLLRIRYGSPPRRQALFGLGGGFRLVLDFEEAFLQLIGRLQRLKVVYPTAHQQDFLR